ncbi:hypothetical protein G7Z17_g2792 [Cylindrodendrum hubeiense]|uniref:Zn(2)-C6 fungal-type domain-containing protein n=1 Tax=Cylindrodendrum hubeiense TaxID=595255 RepID=A0A9P5HI49_9HYPO|nr:hypothetical protein G7Z17_g2792 [Cylindrodendrum hubeiense]
MSTKPYLRPYAARRPPIFRVKTGCFTCRGRKKKCDEVKPLCSGCKRNKLNCRWPTSAHTTRRAFLLKMPMAEKDSIARTTTPCPDTICCTDTVQASPSPADDADDDTTMGLEMATIIAGDGLSPDTSSSSHSHGSPSLSFEDFQSASLPSILPDILPFDNDDDQDTNHVEDSIDLDEAEETTDLLAPVQASSVLSGGWDSVPMTVSPFPCQDGLPLSFANGLILDLVLCQSAAHRAIEDSTKLDVAQGYYNKSLRLFRKSIQDFVDGQESNPLWIVVGALIMCFTETAKGDSQGIVFDHIKGAGPLLTSLLNDSNAISHDLKNFIIEYYVYTASISMISIDPASGSTPFLSPELERQGGILVEFGYVGQLCGGWLELLLLLPQVFRFGQRLRDPDTEPVIPTADEFIVFARLQMQILSFQPLSLLGSDVALCGEIFKQAIHLYLLTALTGSQDKDGPLNFTVESAIDQAFEHLRQLPSTSRINTSLCWALGVIGSCVADEDRRNELRARLDIMFLMIGLGNIRATSTLLEHIWALPVGEQTPWAIWRVMRDNQVWISFA